MSPAKSKPGPVAPPGRVPTRHFVGAHMSIAGGVERAVERAAAVGCTALQVFTKNSNRWDGAPISPLSAAAFRTALAAARIEPRHVISHTSYLINLASPSAETLARSLDALADEMQRAEQLGLMGVVMHPGSPGAGGSAADAIVRIADGARRVLDRVPGTARLLFEATAGTGAHVGSRFEELAELLDRTGLAARTGVCLDTCHIFAAGYELRNAEGFAETMRALDATIGIARVRAIHVNDSKFPLGSRKDRHEHIGEGELGDEAFRLLLSDQRLAGIPLILETEKDDDLAMDRINLARLAALEPQS